MDDVADFAVEEALDVYAEREKELGSDILVGVERSVMLSVIDNKWREHLSEMDYLPGRHRPSSHGPAGPAHGVPA